MKQIEVCISDLSKESTLRNDFTYVSYRNEVASVETYSLLELFEIKQEVDNNYLTQDFFYAEIGDVNNNNEVFPTLLNISKRSENLNDEPLYKKIENNNIIKCLNNDIIISKVRPNLKKFIYIENEKKDIYYTSAFLCLRAKIIPKIMYYALRTIFFKDILALSRMGKGYPTISETDIKNLKFSKKIIHKLLDKKDEILAEIEAIENKIHELRSKYVDELNVINDIFEKAIKLDYEGYKKTKSIKFYNTSFCELSSDTDFRSSFKFQQPLRNHIENDLWSITDKRLKDFVSVPLMTGKSVSPSDYRQNGKFRYIGMSDIKTWYVDEGNMKYVSEDYFLNNCKKRPKGFTNLYSTTIQKGDILMSRSGEGSIGKVALVENDINAVFSDFIVRIRLHEYNSKFAYYYFRTNYFQSLIHIYKKGLGNNTNIFPIVLENFPLLDLNLEEQNNLVGEIDNILERNNSIKKEITELRQRIESYIETVIAEL